MNRVLEEILAATRADLAREPIDVQAMHAAAAVVVQGTSPHRFRERLSGRGTRIIAEIKAASPSAGSIVMDPDVASIARGYARSGASAVSVVTEPHFFRGSREWLRAASEASGLPVIMKDFIVSEGQIVRGIAAGADAVLLLASVLEPAEIRQYLALLDGYGRDGLVEVHDEAELGKAIEAGARLIGVNNRDLRTFDVSLETAERLAPLMPHDVVRVAESGIRSREDVERLETAGFSAFLVGEALLRSTNRDALLGELLGAGRGVAP